VARTSKLKLKGDGGKSKKKKVKTHHHGDQSSSSQAERDVKDTELHGGWWPLTNESSITGAVAIELAPYSYVRAMDNGLFVLAAPHQPGEDGGPDQEEILVAIRSTEGKVAFKSGYGKYLSVDSQKRIIGRSDAIGEREIFEPVFQDGKLALLAPNNCFVSVDEEKDGLIVARNATAGTSEMLKIRSNVDPDAVRREKEASKIPEEERGTIKDAEVKYVKKFQSFQDRKLRVAGLQEGFGEVVKAKEDGRLHEVLLDRRSKMKSDKFCK